MSNRYGKKRRVKSIVTLKKAPKTVVGEKIENLEKRFTGIEGLETRITDLVNTKVNELQNFVLQNVAGALQKVGTLEAKLEAIIENFDKLDMNFMVEVHVLKEVFGQLQQIDEMLKLVDPKTDGKTLDERIDADSIRAGALEWFNNTVSHSFKKEAEERAKRESERLAKVAAARAEKASASEASNVEAELTKAEQPSLEATPGGPGADVPEGAEVFGG